jgi:glycosyltransferase involved in cell wall biosynthesis
MRVLFVVHGFPPDDSGGTELYAHGVATSLASQFGDRVTVLTREGAASRPEYAVGLEHGAPEVIRINNTYRSVTRFSETYDNPSIRSAAARILDELAPDVAHVHHLTHLSTTILDELHARRIPVVLTLHDYWMLCHRGQLLDLDLRICDGPGVEGCARCTGPWGAPPASAYVAARLLRGVDRSSGGRLFRWLGRAARPLGAAGAVERAREDSRRRAVHMRERWAAVTTALAPSAHARDRFVAAGFPADRIHLWPNGTDPAPLCAVTRTRSSTLRLGFLGTLMSSKGPHVLLEAAARLPEGSVRVDLFGAQASYHGDASYGARLAPLLSASHVSMHGVIPRSRVPNALAAIDVLVVPSVWEETSCLAAREALVAGVPVVASRLGALPESVEDGVNGLLFEPGSVGDLARTLRRLLEEPGLLDRLRRARVSIRTLDDDVRSTRALYSRLIAGETA